MTRDRVLALALLLAALGAANWSPSHPTWRLILLLALLSAAALVAVSWIIVGWYRTAPAAAVVPCEDDPLELAYSAPSVFDWALEDMDWDAA